MRHRLLWGIVGTMVVFLLLLVAFWLVPRADVAVFLGAAAGYLMAVVVYWTFGEVGRSG